MRRVLLPLIVSLLAVGCGSSPPSSFEAHLDEYVRQAEQDVDRKVEPRVKLKVVPVELGKRRVERHFYAALPREWRAAGPEEVRTVIQVLWVKGAETTYKGRRAMSYTCGYALVDLQTNKMIQNGSVIGSVISDDFSELAGKAVEEIVKFSQVEQP